jgi:hypothetical protein
VHESLTIVLLVAEGRAYMQLLAFVWLVLVSQGVQPNLPGQAKNEGAGNLEKSAYFAFVDRDYIFTVEVVSPGVPLLNFVSMANEPQVLSAKQVRLTLENRKVPSQTFLVDTGDPKEPITTASVTMRPRSSFGVRLKGEFGEEKEVLGVTLRVGAEDFKFAPLTSLAFENLVLKVNRINLGSPDFRDDWQTLKLEVTGSRMPAARRYTQRHKYGTKIRTPINTDSHGSDAHPRCSSDPCESV